MTPDEFAAKKAEYELRDALRDLERILKVYPGLRRICPESHAQIEDAVRRLRNPAGSRWLTTISKSS